MRKSVVEILLAKIKVNAETGCWEWTACKRAGYGLVRIDGRTLSAHRVSYESHIGAVPDGLHVCHRCDNRCCINPVHLFIGTNADNVADKVEKGRQARPLGISNGNSKLTDADILAIRAASGVTQRELARKYGTQRSYISLIRSRKRWGHVSRWPSPAELSDLADLMERQGHQLTMETDQ